MNNELTHNSGSAATQAGVDYQNRVTAWIAVRILAEQDAAPPWNLPDTVTLELLRCETEDPEDDRLVRATGADMPVLKRSCGEWLVSPLWKTDDN